MTTLIKSSLTMLLCALAYSGFADSLDDLQQALSNESRSEADRNRDGGRRPAQVLSFLGVSKGMAVMDVMAAGGYYTEVLSLAVGEKGTVYAQNPEAMLKYRGGANDKALAARLADDRLANVVRVDKGLEDLGLAPASIDAAVTALNLHDVYNGAGRAAAIEMCRAVLGALKPGAVFGIIDHEGSPDRDNAALHRMQSQQAIDTLVAAGFEIAATSDLLRNPDDGLDAMVFTPGLRGKTSRFLIKARKPM
jgi:predicted methyltransferase